MELLISASLIAAFFAGVAALFAPCCITVLLPSYLASVFRERYKIFLMTFVFFLGILAVFLPLGLGMGLLGQFFNRYHNTIFLIGGSFLAVLGTSLILGKHFSLPFQTKPALKNNQAVSIFTLGVFSAIATTCCAPVLAGVLALSLLPGSVFWGGTYTLSFVLGMVAPLFLIAFFLDKANFTQKFVYIRKPLEYTLGKKKFSVVIADLVAGTAFSIMGILIIFLALTNRLFLHSQYQIYINIYISKFLSFFQNVIKLIPEYILALLLLILLVFIIKRSLRQLKKQ